MGESLAITVQSLLTIRERLVASLVAVAGIAGVILVLLAVLSMARGFERALESNTAHDTIVVLRSGSSSELDSGLSGEQARLIAQSAQLRLASPELYVTVDLAKRSNGLEANAALRGVSEHGPTIRKRFEIVEGRLFEAGKKELIAGVGAAEQFRGLKVGQTLALGPERWQVVGLFRTGGAADSELWTDAAVLQGAYRRGNSYSVVYGKLGSADGLSDLRDALSAQPRLAVQVETEADYFAEQSRTLSTFIEIVGYGIASLMALGALFAALNTMYTAVAERAREIATLRAIGFRPRSIVCSVLAEATLLALAGGLIGIVGAWSLFNGLKVSTLSIQSFSQVAFSFVVTPGLMVQGLFLALCIGVFGGLAPALRAARIPIASGLREQ